MQRLTSPLKAPLANEAVRTRLVKLREDMERISESGLQAEEIDFGELLGFLDGEKRESNKEALTVMNAFLELLETRAAQQMVIASRLQNFTETMTDFFADKRVRISSDEGFVIETEEGDAVEERQLSSGEYHLTYLMVCALTTRRRGTVIAIDEPELSMHVSWQRRLIRALCDCALGAQPQYIFATHSPEIARDFRDSMKEMNGND